MSSRREQTEFFLILLLSWTVYAVCQRDVLVPLAALGLVLPSYLKQVFGRTSTRSYLNLSWRMTTAVAMVSGLLWRMVMPPPPEAVSFFPVILSALQTGTVIVAVMIWFRFAYRWRPVVLRFLAWLTVALSINIPFEPLHRIVFGLFCLVSIGFLILRLYVLPGEVAQDRDKRKKAVTPLMIAYPALLGVTAVVIFSLLIAGIQVSDAVFMHLIRDYLAGGHFNFFADTLELTGSNYSRYDVRPVLEMDRGGRSRYYLVGQVFEDYHNGVWLAPQDTVFEPVPEALDDSRSRLRMVMYEHLQGVIPVPRAVSAMQSRRGTFERDKNGIVVNEQKTIPQVTLSWEPQPLKAVLSREELRRLLNVPSPLGRRLKSRIEKIRGPKNTALQTARTVEGYFKNHYGYSLDVGFHADDRGLLYMLDHQSPAYCSFFASAMTLILREQGIPARMTAGFLATERSRVSRDRFIVRGRDAHAWVEVFVPAFDPETKEMIRNDAGDVTGRWVRFDPTPPESRLQAMAGTRPLNLAADYLWCTMKRMRAGLLDVETKTLAMILVVLVLAVAAEELIKKYVWKKIRLRKRGPVSRSAGHDGQSEQCRKIYRRFEDLMKKRFDLERKEVETDAEWLDRLPRHQEVDAVLQEKIKAFISSYHAVRFGLSEAGDLEQELNRIEQ